MRTTKGNFISDNEDNTTAYHASKSESGNAGIITGIVVGVVIVTVLIIISLVIFRVLKIHRKLPWNKASEEYHSRKNISYGRENISPYFIFKI